MPEDGKEITIEIKQPELLVLLVFAALVLFLELRVTLNTPISFGDEAYHTSLAKWISQNKEYPAWTPFEKTELIKPSYSRPPLWNLLEAGFLLVFGFNEFIVRFLTPFIAVMTGVVIYLLVKKLYNPKVGLIAGILAITIPSFVTYSVLFYTDILLVFYTSLSLFLFILATKENSKKYLILSAIFGSFCFLTKAPGLAIYLFFGIAFIYELFTEKKLLQSFKKYSILFIILLLVPTGFFIRNFYYYNTPSCYNVPFQPLAILNTTGCGVGAVQGKYQFEGRTAQVGTEQDVYSIGLMNYLDFAYGNVWFVILSLFGGLIIFFFKRDKINDFILLYALLLVILFPFTVSRAEDTARYTLAWIPVIVLFIAKYFEEMCNFFGKYSKYVTVLVIIIVMFISYQVLTGKLSVMAQVKQFSPLFFEACDWISQNTAKDASIYTIWAHRALYNCQRNSVPTSTVPDIALSRDANYTLEVAKDNGITHIFIQKFSIDTANQHLGENYDLDFVNFLENNSKYFKKVYENGPDLQQCLQQGGCDGNILYEIDTTVV